MFTGIVQGLGRVEVVRASAQDRDLVVSAPAEIVARLEIGASIALDGVCQTVTRFEQDRFEVHAIAETLRVTTFGSLDVGDALNLEVALAAGEALGGHFVQGHIDGVAHIAGVEAHGESIAYRFRAAEELVRQLVPKGSVAVDGVSLTVGPAFDATHFEVYLIPHTLEVTTLGRKKIGDAVNLETDILGKYILRYLSHGRDAAMTMDDLHRAGFGGQIQ
jgi:riboflavin synthase